MYAVPEPYISVPPWCSRNHITYYSSLISYDFSWFPSTSKIVPLESNLFSSNIRFVPIEVWEYMTLTWCLTQVDLTGFSAFDQSSSEFARHEGVERENPLLHRSRQFRPFARRCFFYVTSMYVSIHTAKVNSFRKFVLPKVLFVLAFHDAMRIDDPLSW